MGSSSGSTTIPAATSSGGSSSSSGGNTMGTGGNTMGTGGASAVPISAQNQQWLNAVYETLLHRPIDATGLKEWGADLNSGMTPTQVVLDIEHTTEYQTDQVQEAYQKLLGVAAPQSAVNYLVGLMQAGVDFRVIEAIIAGSLPFYIASGGTNADFLNAVYRDFLNRPVDPTSEAAWSAFLTAGYSPVQVVLGILTSQEYVTYLVTQDYMTYMGVTPDSNSLGAYVAALMNGTMNNDMVVASLLGSPEWITRNTMSSSSVPIG